MSDKIFLAIEQLTHRYGERVALDHLSFTVNRGQIFGLLGPNGSGKTTLFRILSTLLPIQTGRIRLGTTLLDENLDAIRQQLGIVFQSPSLDKKLTVKENLVHQGHLYGLQGSSLQKRIAELLARFRLEDRQRDTIETLSGGLQRRVEVAKGLLHRPSLLLLDEPTTGLDPGARIDLWNYLQEMNAQEYITILVTTHLMDEAERCHELMILHQGRRVCSGTPLELRQSISGEVITIEMDQAEKSQRAFEQIVENDGRVALVGGKIRIETNAEKMTTTRIVEKIRSQFGTEIQAFTVSRPSLEDVFIQNTGQKFEAIDNSPFVKKAKKK